MEPAARKVEIELTDAAKAWLAVHGYDRVHAARPMARLIQNKIRAPLARGVAVRKLEHGRRGQWIPATTNRCYTWSSTG